MQHQSLASAAMRLNVAVRYIHNATYASCDSGELTLGNNVLIVFIDLCVRPVLKHGPRSLTCELDTGLLEALLS